MEKDRYKVLLTGATGFLGSHIAEELVVRNYDLLLTKRKSSSLWRCKTFFDKACWINIDESDWKAVAKEFKPDIIINAAWDGVDAGGREQWERQLNNILFQQDLLEIALYARVKKIIGLGSQAEYGNFTAVVDEEFPVNPQTAYGAIKLACLQILKTFCQLNNIDWYWLRIFSVFGEKESQNWLIPSVIKNMLTGSSMELTQCEQQYSYVYVKDLSKIFSAIIEKTPLVGVYNLCAEEPIRLRSMIEMIKYQVNPDFNLLFGALPYRTNQCMLNHGSTKKLRENIIILDNSDFELKLSQTVSSYMQ